MRKILKEGVEFGKIAEKAVAIIKGKGHTVIMFTLDGMETADPEDARRFYVKDPNYMVTIDEDNATIRINKNSNVSLDDIEGILTQLKNLARSYMLKSQLQVFGKEITPKDFAFQAKKYKDKKMNNVSEAIRNREYREFKSKLRGREIITKAGRVGKIIAAERARADSGDIAYQFLVQFDDGERQYIPRAQVRLQPKSKEITEAALSPMTGSKKTSYQTLESTKIIVRHRKPVAEEVRGSRSRQISAIFIERAGERFRFPHNNLTGARAMARHIDEGGEIHDSVGTYIIESVANLIKLSEFIRYTRTNKLINEDSEDIIKIVRENMAAYRRELTKFQGATTYAKMCEQIASREGSELEEDTAELKDLFTVRKFDEKIGETLPLIKRLVTEKNAWRSMIEEASTGVFAVTSTEDLIEADVIEFDSPIQKLGYKIRALSERVIEESELSKFVNRVGNKLIEGGELSKFEKSVVANVLENIEVAEQTETEFVDKLEEVSTDFESKIDALAEMTFNEEPGDFDHGYNYEGMGNVDFDDFDEPSAEDLAGMSVERPDCDECDGSGIGLDDVSDCYYCNGTGKVEDDNDDFDGQPSEYDEWQDYMGGDDWDQGQYEARMFQLAGVPLKEQEKDPDPEDFMDDCPDCGGNGTDEMGNTCHKCKGEGYV